VGELDELELRLCLAQGPRVRHRSFLSVGFR
jgi:hypothetical protein